MFSIEIFKMSIFLNPDISGPRRPDYSGILPKDTRNDRL